MASIALIAIAIAGIFFGAGYSLLASSVRGPVSSLDYRFVMPKQQGAEHEREHSPPAALSPPVAGNVASVALTPDNPLPVAGRAAPPVDPPLLKTSEAPTPVAEGSRMAELPARSGSSARPGHDAPEQSATTSVTTAAAAVADRPAPRPSLSAAEISDLLKHGDTFLAIGDLTSARLFYERAATAGNSGAALRLGATFDPDFLDRAGLRNVKGDASVARSWYSRALDLGAPEAQRQLNSLNSIQGLPPR